MVRTVSAEHLSVSTSDSALNQRILSVDVLRGFDMFWIMGADSLVYALNRMTQTAPVRFVAKQLEHSEWAGFHFYDLIFPLFIFIVGVSLVFSLGKSSQTGKASLLKRIVRRTILLFILGLIYYGGIQNTWPDIRLTGVLNRIAVVYCVSALLFFFLKPRSLAAVATALLALYWALLTFVPIRDVRLTKTDLARMAAQSGDVASARLLSAEGNFSAVKNSPAWAQAERLFYGSTAHVTGRFDPGYNLSDHLDFQYLPGRKYDVFYDPEGLLSTLAAISTCLLGVFAGLLLKQRTIPDLRKVLYLICCGAGALAAGGLLHLQIPVIKKIWTPSFVLVSGGYNAILLGVFYLIVDVCRARRWCQPFVWIGMNSIAIYMAGNFMSGFRSLSKRLIGGDLSTFLNTQIAKGLGDLAVAAIGLALSFWLVHFLYKRKIFLRL